MTIAIGLAIKATGGALGTALPPFVLSYRPELDPAVIVSVCVLAGAGFCVPRLVDRRCRPVLTAIGLYALALGLGLALNAARAGVHDWWAVFDTRHGSYEANFEYLTGLPALIHGIHYYVQDFANVFPWLPTHAKGNPPGPLVAVDLLGISRAGPFAALCIGVGALCAPLAYDLGRTLGDERRGRVAGVLTAFAPSVLLFGVTSADYAFAALGMIVACLLARASGAPGDGSFRRVGWLAAGGLAAGFASFFSWLLLAIPAYSVLLALVMHGRRSAILVAAACVGGIVAFDLLLWIVWRYDPFSALSATHHAYEAGLARRRPYAFWLFGSPAAWAAMLGVPVLWCFLKALSDGESSALALAAVIIAAAVIGVTKAETERIWLPFVPLAAVAAASALPARRLAPALWVMAAQALAIEVLFFTIW